MSVTDILTFFKSSTRNENDATNKKREDILHLFSNPPKEYLEHPEFGNYWKIIQKEWNEAIKKIGVENSVPEYTSIKILKKGGRKFNYDADILYYNGTVIVAQIKLELKYGGTCIDELPQFLSLQAKTGLFSETYDKFWYEHYLDKYIACDVGITLPKPSLDLYLKNVISTKYSINPFFLQLKDRESFFQNEKIRLLIYQLLIILQNMEIV